MTQRVIFDEVVWRNLATAVIIFTFVVAVFLFHYGVKMKNGDYCSAQDLYDDRHTTLSNSTFILDKPESSILQRFDWHYNDFRYVKDAEICFSGTAVLSEKNTVNIQLRADDNIVLKNFYLSNGLYTSPCITFDTSNITAKSYIGLHCVNCDTNDYFLPEHRLLSDKVNFFYSDGSNVTYVNNERVFNSRYTTDCRPTYQKILYNYYVMLGVLFFVWLFLLGVEWLKRTLWGGWFD